jgi:hypothetical protein
MTLDFLIFSKRVRQNLRFWTTKISILSMHRLTPSHRLPNSLRKWLATLKTACQFHIVESNQVLPKTVELEPTQKNACPDQEPSGTLFRRRFTARADSEKPHE